MLVKEYARFLCSFRADVQGWYVIQRILLFILDAWAFSVRLTKLLLPEGFFCKLIFLCPFKHLISNSDWLEYCTRQIAWFALAAVLFCVFLSQFWCVSLAHVCTAARIWNPAFLSLFSAFQSKINILSLGTKKLVLWHAYCRMGECPRTELSVKWWNVFLAGKPSQVKQDK